LLRGCRILPAAEKLIATAAEEFAIVFPNKASEEVFVYLDRMGG